MESYIFEIEDFKNGRSPADCCLWRMKYLPTANVVVSIAEGN